MRFQLSPRSEAVTVYTSDRKSIDLEPGGIIETDDLALIVRLKGDPLNFSEYRENVKPTSVLGRKKKAEA